METVPLLVILKIVWSETWTPTILGILQSPDNVAEVEETVHQSLLQEWLLQVRAYEPQIRPVLAFIYAYMKSWETNGLD